MLILIVSTAPGMGSPFSLDRAKLLETVVPKTLSPRTTMVSSSPSVESTIFLFTNRSPMPGFFIHAMHQCGFGYVVPRRLRSSGDRRNRWYRQNFRPQRDWVKWGSWPLKLQQACRNSLWILQNFVPTSFRKTLVLRPVAEVVDQPTPSKVVANWVILPVRRLELLQPWQMHLCNKKKEQQSCAQGVRGWIIKIKPRTPCKRIARIQHPSNQQQLNRSLVYVPFSVIFAAFLTAALLGFDFLLSDRWTSSNQPQSRLLFWLLGARPDRVEADSEECKRCSVWFRCSGCSSPTSWNVTSILSLSSSSSSSSPERELELLL